MARALETVRGGEEEAVLALLRQAADAGDAECGLSLARFLARLASVEQSPERREVLLRQLRELAHLGPAVARLIGECGDVVLVASRPAPEAPEAASATIRVRASRLALVEASEYFRALLAGPWAEGRETEVRVETRFPEQLERVVHFLYVGDVEELRNPTEVSVWSFFACLCQRRAGRRSSCWRARWSCRCRGWPRTRPSS